MMIRPYYTLPDLPDAGLLQRYLSTLGIIVPVARTNLCTNPSLETADTWISRGTITTGGRTTDESYHGIYSYFCTPSAVNTTAARFGGVGWGSITPAASTTYAVSAKVLGALGVPYRLYVENATGPATITSTAFVGTGHWQWIWLVYTEPSVPSGQRNYIVSKNDSLSSANFYVDGLQVEVCAAGELYPTTYLDGDQLGLVPNQYPPAYGWNGAPHASTSYRSGQTRAGGRIMRLKDFGFLLSAIIGLGLAVPTNEALTFAQIDGGQYQDTIKPPRQFSLVGRWAGATPTELDSGRARLARLLDRDRVALRQPLVLVAQAEERGAGIGEMLQIGAIYAGGLEGQAQDLPSAAGQITFTQYLPYVTAHDQGVALAVQQSISNADYLVQRTPSGQWSVISGLNGTVQALAIGPDGALYVAGAFTTAGVSNTSRIARWDGSAWTPLGSGANGTVNELVFDAAGNLYAGGAFSLMGGVANTSAIARWNGSAWSALSTGLTGSPFCFALIIDRQGILYAGGSFTNAGASGADNIASWNGTTWSVLGSATAINASVLGLALDGAGTLYVAGAFTLAGGIIDADRIVKWNGSAWAQLFGGANATVQAVAVGANGIVYAGGTATVFGGITVGHIAQWNGVAWSTLGTAMNGDVTTLTVGPSGNLYAGGLFTTVNGVTYPDSAAVWNGYTWLPLDINLPGTPTLTAVLEREDGTLYLGYETTGTAVAAGITTATNDGTAGAYPTLTIRGPSSGTSRIYQLINTTTGAAIYFNLTIAAGEVATLTLNPTNITFQSSTQGNILNTVLPGSDLAQFILQPGDNTISFYAAAASVTASLEWDISYLSMDDALYPVVP